MKNKSLATALLTIGLTMNSFQSSHLAAQNLSHEQRAASYQDAKQALIDKIQIRGDLPYASVDKQLELLEQLTEFEVGRFLIERGGANGFWIHHAVTHPTIGRLTNLDRHGKPFHPLETFLLDSAPITLATQERFSFFKAQIQQRISEGCCLASVPSGLMADLLDIDYSALENFTLYGIDLDPETLSQAKGYAEEKSLLEHCHFYEKDAWALGMTEKFDLLASNGLTIYEHDNNKVVDLYRKFYNALKPSGILVTSFMTPPPAPGFKTEWVLEHVNPQNALLQKIIFADVLGVKWQAFRTEETVRAQLKEAGFQEIEILYDKAHIFPTVVAKK